LKAGGTGFEKTQDMIVCDLCHCIDKITPEKLKSYVKNFTAGFRTLRKEESITYYAH
jgi:hypothetical protein